MKLGVPGADAWMFDLIAPDDVVRGRALARHQDLVARRSGVSHWPDGDRTIFWYLEALWHADPQGTAVRVEHWPFVALYLRWEARFPDQWRSRKWNPWSPWSTKEGVLRQLGRYGVPAEAKREAADLLIDVVQRSYRCKDWVYPVLVRHVVDADFRDRLGVLAGADDPLVRLRARFLLHLADHPEHEIRRKTWLRWLDGQQQWAPSR
jgi:hypothetical protein